MGFIQSAWDSVRGKNAAKRAASESNIAANQAAEGQEAALAYLKEREALPMEIRDEALRGLRDFYQVPDAPMSQAQVIEEAKSSPLYAAIIGSRKSGEDAILRNASATGGLRSGNSNAALSDFNMQLENQALLQAFDQTRQRDDFERSLQLSGLSGLANIPTNEAAITNLTAAPAMTRAQGRVAGAQAMQQAGQNTSNLIQGGMQALATYLAFSDLRLKRNIHFVEMRNGFPWYEWDWIPEAEKLGLQGSDEGVLAHQVYDSHPDAIGEREGFLVVDYKKLGLERTA